MKIIMSWIALIKGARPRTAEAVNGWDDIYPCLIEVGAQGGELCIELVNAPDPGLCACT